MRGDLGDFQTPPALVSAVLGSLGPIGSRWGRVLEPTCGRGHFIAGLLDRADPPGEILGIERQAGHLDEARRLAGRPTATRLGFEQANIFDLDLARDLVWQGDGPLLILGNPPWVTAAGLGQLGSGNRPPRAGAGATGLVGLDARTGRANFDLAEAIWLKLLRELAPQRPTIVLLCKAAAARRVLGRIRVEGLPVTEAAMHALDARRWFGAAVEACLLRVKVGPPGAAPARSVALYDRLDAPAPTGSLGLAGPRLIADEAAHARSGFADGPSPLGWRQGIKHDAAPVLELGRAGDGWANGLGEPVDVEPEYVFPLLKCGDLDRGAPAGGRALIVPQVRLNEGTGALERSAPRLWAYLAGHAGRLAARKSSIYQSRPPFAIFGVGDYSFTPYKVAVSGLHQVPRFRAVGPSGGRPVVFDDASYLAPSRSADHAALAAALLEDPIAADRLAATVFRAAKRPITKAVLSRVDLAAVLARCDRVALRARFDDHRLRLAVPPAPPWPGDGPTLDA